MRFLSLLSVSLIAFSTLTACSNDDAADGASAGELNLYSSRHYDTDIALYENFTEATGIKINLIEAGADELIERIKSEGEASTADLLITVDAGRLWRAEQAGIFQPIDSPILNERLPENMRHPDGLWVGLSKRARVIVYPPQPSRHRGERPPRGARRPMRAMRHPRGRPARAPPARKWRSARRRLGDRVS